MTHEFDGTKYEKASAHQKEWGITLIAELNLQGTERVLDLGCGDGTLTAMIAELVPEGEVIGIDASRGMIDAALPRVRDNLQFLVMDINELDYAGQFDLVFSNAALHWVKDHRRLLLNVRRALRDGGRFRFNFAGDGNCSHFFAVVREAISACEFAEFFSHFAWPWYMPSVEEYSTLMQECALGDGHAWGENADRHFPHAEAMIRWLDQPSLVPFMAYLPETKKDEFRRYVIRRMIAETQQDDGRCFETFRRINVSGRRQA